MPRLLAPGPAPPVEAYAPGGAILDGRHRHPDHRDDDSERDHPRRSQREADFDQLDERLEAHSAASVVSMSPQHSGQ